MKKGYKVTDVKREKKIGVAAENLEELIEKSCKKLGFNVSCAECRLCVAEDGTQVDDDEYLATLPSQTLFILLKDTEKTVTDFDYYYNLIRAQKKDYIDTGAAAKEFLSVNMKEKVKVFQKYIAAADDAGTMLSERTQDPGWFEGLEPSEKTKEQSMSKRVKDRMRGYYYKTKSALQSSDVYIHSKNGRGKKLIDQFLTDLRKILESYKYNDTYFNRKAQKSARICDETGLFQCGGVWSSDKCLYEGEHVINPYRSREERIIFQTWNLDHKIELSRSIIPKILEAINGLYSGDIKCMLCDKDSKVGGIEADRYYLQIFTRENLKLVHIVCHYKDTNFEISRPTDCTERLGAYDEEQAGSSGMETEARTPDSEDILTPGDLSPPLTSATRTLSTDSEDLGPDKKKLKNSDSEDEVIKTDINRTFKLMNDLNDNLEFVKKLVTDIADKDGDVDSQSKQQVGPSDSTM